MIEWAARWEGAAGWVREIFEVEGLLGGSESSRGWGWLGWRGWVRDGAIGVKTRRADFGIEMVGVYVALCVDNCTLQHWPHLCSRPMCED